MTTQHPLDAFGARLRDLIQRGFPADDDAFNRFALELFALQCEHNGPFQKFCCHRGVTPESVGHWSDIPAMPAVAFKECELTSLAPMERTTVFHSSGTTEHRPSRHFHSAASLAVYETSLLAWFQRNLLQVRMWNLEVNSEPRSSRGDEAHSAGELAPPHVGCYGWETAALLALAPHAVQAPHSSLVHMFETVMRALGAPASRFVGAVDASGAWSLNVPATLAALREFAAGKQAVVLLGTAFSFVHLLDLLECAGAQCSLPAGSRVMETGGYKGRSRELPRAELHRLLTERLGVPPAHIVCEYGMSELSSQAYDLEVRRAGPSRTGHSGVRNGARVFRFPPWARVQIVSPETGEEVSEGATGLIRVFDLANVRSVLGVQTEDLGVRRGGGFELVGRAVLAEARGCSLMAT